MSCTHDDYDNFAFCCALCGMSEIEMHAESCDGVVSSVDDDMGHCAKCGDELVLNGGRPASCDHSNYEHSFDTCAVCGKDGATIHQAECGSDNVMETEANIFECLDCSFTYFEQMFTDCDHCHEMVIPIEDDTFDGVCPGCGKDPFSGEAAA